MNWNKFLYILVIVLSAACNSKEQVQLIEKDVDELVFASGKLVWDGAYNLTAQTEGELESLSIDIGMDVHQGQIVGKIKNALSDANAQTSINQLQIAEENVKSNAPLLLQLEQSIAFAQTKYNQDKLMAERYSRLYDAGATSAVELENKQVQAKSSLTSLNSLKKQYAAVQQQAKLQKVIASGQAKNNVTLQRYNNVQVSTAGAVINCVKNTGDYVRRGEVIATIANKNKLEIVLNVDENSISKVKIGQTVYIKLNTEKDTTYLGKIVEIENNFDVQNQSFVCKVQLDKMPSTIYNGTQLEANILVGHKNQALLLPRKYLGFGNKVQIKGEKQPRIVKIGILSTEFVEILDGVKKGEIVEPLKP